MERLVDAVYFDTSILRQQPFADLKRSLKPLLEDLGTFPCDWDRDDGRALLEAHCLPA
jgi:hypothetical protein